MEPTQTKTKSSNKLRIIGLLLITAVIGVVLVAAIRQANQPPRTTIGSPGATAEANHQAKVPIFIETGGQTINAAEVQLTFDPKLIEVVSVSKEKSFFKIWIDGSPKFSNTAGTISFAGGVFNPGFKGKGQVGSVVLRSKKPLTTVLHFAAGTQVLLNDGKGTAVPLELSPIKVELP